MSELKAETRPIVERVWLCISNVCERGLFKVSLEINGAHYRDEFYSYPHQDDGIVSQSTNLTWLLTESAPYKTLEARVRGLEAEVVKVTNQAMSLGHKKLELEVEVERLSDRAITAEGSNETYVMNADYDEWRIKQLNEQLTTERDITSLLTEAFVKLKDECMERFEKLKAPDYRMVEDAIMALARAAEIRKGNK